MAGKEVSNSYGTGPVEPAPDVTGATRNGVGDPVSEQDANASDSANASAAIQAKANGRPDLMSQYISRIYNPNFKLQTYLELYGSMGDQTTPASLFSDCEGGISNPNSLFFMMVFYLQSESPKFSWDLVLNAAKIRSNGAFVDTTPTSARMPTQPKPPPADVAPITTDAVGLANTLNAQRGTETGILNNQKDSTTNKFKPTNVTGSVGGVSKIVVWPFQNLPAISNGISKSVNWDNKPNATTFAEPILTVNGGASSIELKLEFTYVVGLNGIGDSNSMPPSITSDAISTPQNPEDSAKNFWSVEDLMGVCYLAQSLVLPWLSSDVIGSKAANIKGKEAPYFPIVFLRHHSLFPYIAPFIVKGVEIVPDEGKPLMITNKNKANNTDLGSLPYSAIRQVVKIVLTLESANYYATVFQGSTAGDNVQKLTSGKTYSNLASALLAGRI